MNNIKSKRISPFENPISVEIVTSDSSQSCVHPDVDVKPCDIMDGLPYNDNTFDALTVTEVIEHMEYPFFAVQEFNRVIKPGGILLMTTPNYGNIEARMNYLFRGTLPSTLSFKLEAPKPGRAHGHINPMTVMRLKYLLMTNGFEIVNFSTVLPKRRMWFLLPISALVFIYVHLLWLKKRRKRYHIPDQMKALFGGRSLIVVSRKKK